MLPSKLLAGTSSADPAWNIARAKFLGTPQNWLSIHLIETNPQDLFFKPDGTKMYTIGRVDFGRIHEYDLSTAWQVSTAVNVGVLQISAQENGSTGLFFNPDGTKMYIIGTSGDDVNEYNLSTAWSISTATFVQLFSIGAQDTVPQGLFFKPDGTKMYVVGQTNDRVYEYNLSTAWDISTAVYLQFVSIVANSTEPTGLFFKPDGTQMYILDTSTGGRVKIYNLSTAWNVFTATYVSQIGPGVIISPPTGLFFKPDGLVMYILTSNGVNLAVLQYSMSTAWNLSTSILSFPNSNYIEVNPIPGSPPVIRSSFFKPDGTKMYVLDALFKRVFEYNLSTAWDISTATYLQFFGVSAQDNSPQDLFFKPDGTKMYVVGDTGDDINEYTLSVAWDISTAVYVQIFSLPNESPQAVEFSPDGTQMYILVQTPGGLNLGPRLHQFVLSTAWNISTATYLRAFNIAANDSGSSDVCFKPDGLKMYVLGTNQRKINQYYLTTAWDISTAVFYNEVFLRSLAVPVGSPFGGVKGISIGDNGLRVYLTTQAPSAIWEFDLT